MLSEFAKIFERKVWRLQVAHLHNATRALSSPSRCFQLSTNLDKDFFRYLYYCGKNEMLWTHEAQWVHRKRKERGNRTSGQFKPLCHPSASMHTRQHKWVYIITKSMRALWLVNQLWVIVPVNPRKNRAFSELLHRSNRPQVFYEL